jgi:hypothetical protein
MMSITGCGVSGSISSELAPPAPGHVAGEVDRHRLQPEAQSQARDVVLAGVSGGGDLALEATLAEPTGDHDAVEVGEATGGQQALDVLGLDPVDLDLGAVVEPGVLAGLDDRQVGVDQQLTYLPMSPMRTGTVVAASTLVDHVLPLGQVDRRVEAGAPRRPRCRGPPRAGSAAARRCCGRRPRSPPPTGRRRTGSRSCASGRR